MKRMVSIIAMVLCTLTAHVHAQWQMVLSGYDGDLEDVFFKSTDTGYAVGSSSVLKTTDGGRTWSLRRLSVMDHAFRTLFFLTPDKGFVAGKVLYSTIDGGTTWDSVFSLVEPTRARTFTSMAYCDTSSGLIVGERTLHTTDGGLTWSLKPWHPRLPAHPLTLVFTNDSIGFSGGFDDTFAGSFGIIAKTTDGGQSWRRTLAQVQLSAGMYINDIAFATPLRGWAVGSRSLSTPPYGETRMLFTTDGGETWEASPTTFVHTLNTIAVVGEQGLIVGDEIGDIFSSTDAGSTWVRDEATTGGRSVNAIVNVDDQVAYAVTDKGRIFKRSLVTSVEDSSSDQLDQIHVDITNNEIAVSIDPAEFVPGKTSVHVFDAMGRTILASNIDKPVQTFTVGVLARGSYYVQMRNGLVVRTTKHIRP